MGLYVQLGSSFGLMVRVLSLFPWKFRTSYPIRLSHVAEHFVRVLRGIPRFNPLIGASLTLFQSIFWRLPVQLLRPTQTQYRSSSTEIFNPLRKDFFCLGRKWLKKKRSSFSLSFHNCSQPSVELPNHYSELHSLLDSSHRKNHHSFRSPSPPVHSSRSDPNRTK